MSRGVGAGRRVRAQLARVVTNGSRALTTARAASVERRLVWMLGSPRSGSSWLLKLLSEHDAVAPVDEPLIGMFISPFLCDLPGGYAPALDVSNFTIRRLQRAGSQFFSEPLRHVWEPRFAALLRDRLIVEAALYPSPVPPRRRLVVIKEPNGSQSADVLMRVLPRARLLFLLRDGRDVVDSELHGNLPGGWVTREFPGLRGIQEEDRLAFVVQSAHKWLWRTEVVQQTLRAHPGPKLTVRYEDLLEHPALQLRAVFDWLGLAVTDAQLSAWLERNRFERLASGVTGPESFFRSGSKGSHRGNLRPDELAALEGILGAKLRELGYL